MARRLRRRFGFVVSGANVLGAALVYVFLSVVLPYPKEIENDEALTQLNLVLAAVYIAAAVLVGTTAGRHLAGPIYTWLSEERSPTPSERERTLAYPLLGYKVMGPQWIAAALLFGIVNSFSSVGLGALVGFTIALGGLTTCTLVILWVERAMRSVLALAMASGVPEEPVGPGVGARVVLSWALASGVALLGLVLVSVAVLLGADFSAERLAVTALFLGALGLSVGLLAVSIAGRSVADPVEEVRGALAEVERGNLQTEVPVYDGNEVGLLAAGFNRMVAGLRERERLRDLFGRHVGKDVARAAVDAEIKLGGEVRDVGVLFVDLTGSTTIAARRPPTEVVALLNDFFRIVVEAADRHGGWVNKFEGDAALCVFGAPTPSEDPAGDALRAARELRARLTRELPDVDAGIGVSAGPAVAGNVGAEERFEYTVIGDPVNSAARLCELAKSRPDRLLASDDAVAKADAAEAKHWSVGESVTLRGRPSPTGLATATA